MKPRDFSTKFHQVVCLFKTRLSDDESNRLFPAASDMRSMTMRLGDTLDALEGMLAKLQGPSPPESPNSTRPSGAARYLDFSLPSTEVAPIESAGASADPALMDTPTVLAHLRRLFLVFSQPLIK